MSLVLLARGTGVLPYQFLEQEMALLGPTYAAADQARAHPTQFKGASMTGNPAGLDRVGEEGQPLLLTKTADDVVSRGTVQAHRRADDSK
jgi:hypothetical protein